ncbi:unnamed protein product [Didymodactylos carnosus]|uniref:Ubiquitin-like domain-containing protein n=1 Tax=Didymodactylos carnosus TaxID=1234261 RepID=A0A814C198_9BILA|nr:unnamed protein product [Didymodactylos carnosus]CAF1083591.1 unnamed protein product [Didymodactylos carnosus]CAF3714662.1 unnamed protein product [Didymodactylos carnosus]CAF3846212.1 unnamed protein product [Didymodactylos carnosus]
MLTYPKQINLTVIRKSDGKTMRLHVPEYVTVHYLKTQLKQSFHSNNDKFHLYYKGKHIRSRHLLKYYGISNEANNIQIILK